MTELFDALMLRDAVRQLVPLRHSPAAMRAERLRLAAEMGHRPRAAARRARPPAGREAAAIAALPREFDLKEMQRG